MGGRRRLSHRARCNEGDGSSTRGKPLPLLRLPAGRRSPPQPCRARVRTPTHPGRAQLRVELLQQHIQRDRAVDRQCGAVAGDARSTSEPPPRQPHLDERTNVRQEVDEVQHCEHDEDHEREHVDHGVSRGTRPTWVGRYRSPPPRRASGAAATATGWVSGPRSPGARRSASTVSAS